MNANNRNNLTGASTTPLRVDVVLIPEAPLFSMIISASQAVTARFRNQNIIDAEKFPPHASLHICSIPTGRLEEFSELLRSSAAVTTPVLKPVELKMGSSGYLTLKLEITPEIRQLHNASINAAAHVREKWSEDNRSQYRRYFGEDLRNFEKYGNAYVLQKFDLHMSIAKVEIQDQDEAYEVAQNALGTLTEERASKLQICDIGMRNEKWVLLKSM